MKNFLIGVIFYFFYCQILQVPLSAVIVEERLTQSKKIKNMDLNVPCCPIFPKDSIH